jgi:hypothetical protein
MSEPIIGHVVFSSYGDFVDVTLFPADHELPVKMTRISTKRVKNAYRKCLKWLVANYPSASHSFCVESYASSPCDWNSPSEYN